MSNEVNEIILEQILDDVLVLHKGNNINVVNAIKDEFGVESLPLVRPKGPYIDDEDVLINKLVELGFEAQCAWGG